MIARSIARATLLAVCIAAISPAALGQSQPDGQPKPKAQASNKINLRPKYTKGDQHRFAMTMSVKSKQGTGAEATDRSSTQDIGLLLRVKEVTETGGASLELVYESLKIKVTDPLMNVDFDSTKPAAKGDELSELTDSFLRPIVGLTLNVTSDKDGNITGISGAEGIAGGALAGQLTGADFIKNAFGPIFSIRKGAGEAAVGESWTNEDVIDGPVGQMRLATTNTLSSHRSGMATIDMKGGITLTPGTSTGFKTPAIKDSTLTGKAVWDTERGMLSEMETRQKLSVEQEQDGAKVPITNDMTVKVVRKK